MDFTGKLILIVGGSSGIGLATARQLAAKGADVWILARTKEKLVKAESEIRNHCRSSGQRIGYLVADVSDEKQVTSVLNQWIAEAGVPDIVINSNGIVEPGYFENQSAQVFHLMMDANFFGVLHVIKAVIPGMIARQSGHIVNLSSLAGLVGWYGYTAYASSKFAIRGLSEQLRTELKPYGIRVSIVFPNDTQTPQLEYDDLHKPPETKALTSMFGSPLKADFVARTIIKGIEHNKFSIIPGWDLKALIFLYNSFPGLILPVLDKLVSMALNKTQSSHRKPIVPQPVKHT
jgi:3-dehydrosphinganine reductase